MSFLGPSPPRRCFFFLPPRAAASLPTAWVALAAEVEAVGAESFFWSRVPHFFFLMEEFLELPEKFPELFEPWDSFSFGSSVLGSMGSFIEVLWVWTLDKVMWGRVVSSQTSVIHFLNVRSRLKAVFGLCFNRLFD